MSTKAVWQSERERLLLRETRLRFLILELQAELGDVVHQINSGGFERKARLDRMFFAEVVAPLLGSGGLTARQLFNELRTRKFEVNYDNLRLLLTRSQQRGVIKQIKIPGHPSKWAVAPLQPTQQLEDRPMT